MKLVSAKALMVPQISMEPLTILNKVMYPYLVRDRFNYLNKNSAILFAEPKVNLPSPLLLTNVQCALRVRGREIISQARNKKIAFVADNHTDCLSALYALVQELSDPEQLTVYTEEPLDLKIPCKLVLTEDILEDLNENLYERVVFGFSGSSLFEPEIMNPVFKNYAWMDGIRNSLGYALSNSKENLLRKEVEGYSNLLQIPVETFSDLSFLFNFGCKWSLIQDLPNLYLFGSRNKNKGIHFFDSLDIQRYALFNFESFKGNNTIRYRSPLRQYLYDCTGERSWLTRTEKYDPYRLPISEDPVIRVRTNQGIQLFKSNAGECSPCYKRLSMKIRESFRK